MQLKTVIGTNELAQRKGTMKLVFAWSNGEVLQQPALVDATPEGTDRTVFAMFGVLAGLDYFPEKMTHGFWRREEYKALAMDMMRFVYAALKHGQTFARDPDGEERVIVRTLAEARLLSAGRLSFVGDCDDVAFFAATLLASAGLDPVFCVVGPEASVRDPMRFRHILWGVKLPWGGAKPTRENVILADSQEGGVPGFWPLVGDMGVARIYSVDGEHSVFRNVREWAKA